MKKFRFLYILCFISILACAQKNKTKVEVEPPAKVNYTTEVVVSGLDIPWGLAFLPDGAFLITEKSGELIHFKNGKKTTIGGLPSVRVLGQGGLLDIALDPDYTKNGWIYITYASPEGGGRGANTALIRAKLNNYQLSDIELLYKASPNSTRGQHFGSRIAFDNDGYLYFSIGDRGNRDENPQDITRDCGKIYRLHPDGRIPADNPFVNTTNAREAIYSYGHRNPQGMVKHPETGAIWIHEHGPRGGDEINIIQAGKNYGWPKASHGVNYSGTKFTEHTTLPGMESPLFHWTPSIAPSGMAFVTSNRYPKWKGSLLVGSLKFQYLERLVLKNNTVIQREKLLKDMGRVRTIKQGIDGSLYAGIEGIGIVKIIPNN